MTFVTIDPSFRDIFWYGARAVIRANGRSYNHDAGLWERGPRGWFCDLSQRYSLHPVIMKIVEQGVRPIDWHQLLLEWPHVSVEDPMQLAYTRDERKGQDNVQTRTSIGKYLSRHWPHVPDHMRRDWMEAYGNHKFELWDTKEMIICGIELGPQSCMKSSYGNIPFDYAEHNPALCTWFNGDKDTKVAWHYHPYSVYAPEYGWRMAVRLDPGKPDIVLARGLVNVEDENNKVFVRTYKRGEYDHSNSGSDERLEAWLKNAKFRKVDSWPDGLRLKRLPHPTDDSAEFMVPYIDGGTQTVGARDKYLAIDHNGAYQCDNTDGTPSGGRETMGECGCCGDTVYEDDDERVRAGFYEDTLICGSCACDYAYVRGQYGSRTNSYYVHEDNAVEVRGNRYDKEHLPDYIKELHDGEFEHEDYCVYSEAADAYYHPDDVVRCETDDEWYPEYDLADYNIVEIDGEYYKEDDDDIFEYDGTWYLKADGWQDAETNKWYPDSEDSITLNGDTFHPDTLRDALNEAGQL